MKSFFGKGLVLFVLVSGLFFEAYLVHRSGGFADFITHFTMLDLNQTLHKTTTMPLGLIGLLLPQILIYISSLVNSERARQALLGLTEITNLAVDFIVLTLFAVVFSAVSIILSLKLLSK